MKKTVLREYARLIVRSGVNVQKGQEVLIYADLDQPEFVQMVVEEAYKAKAKKVTVEWNYQPLQKLHVRHQSVKTLGEVPEWQKARLQHYVDVIPCRIHLMSEDPDGLKGINMAKLAKSRQLRYPIVKPYSDQLENKDQWCIAAVPGAAWAKKVFPELPEQEAMDRLWDAIFTSVRISGKGDAVARWREHVALLKSRIAKLNELHFTSLYYQNSLGTSLNIKLPETHVWAGGDNTSRAGFPFVANMPTEEVFTAPLRDGIDGVVYAALPLVHNGNIIENFHFVIKDGKIVEAHAEKGEDILKAAIAEDEGASYFGEVALVPYDSPISNQKILFYNTLFDENAACHLAFGEAYPECVKGGEAMSKEELKAAGLNDSNTHVDFMVGTADLSIIGTTKDGREIPVFVNGNFAL